MAALARLWLYTFYSGHQRPPTEGSGGLLSPLSQLQFTRFLEVCQDLSGLSALQQQWALQRWLVRMLGCRGGAGTAQTHSSNSSRLCNYARPKLSGSFLTVLTATHTNRCLLIFLSFHLQKKS